MNPIYTNIILKLTIFRKNFDRQFNNSLLLILLFVVNNICSASVNVVQPQLKLWYDKPAKEWMTSALPIGNGELGGMFFGGVEKEQLQFNEKTLWTGSSSLRGAYQSFGDLFLEFCDDPVEYTDYRRELDLDEAIGTVSYKIEGIEYIREYFASNPDSVIVVRLTTSKPEAKLSFTVSLYDSHQGRTEISGNNIAIRGKLDLLSYEAQVQVLNEGGVLIPDEDKIKIEGADAVTIHLTGATNYQIKSDTYIGESENELHKRISKRLSLASAKSYEFLKKSHLEDYQSLFNRVKLDLGASQADIPTDSLLHFHRESLYLDILYFQYGRYLMLSSSRGMDLPNNLQGIWNNNNTPPWQCDIHTNINIQMNYWPAEITNLSECHLPFINYISTEAMRENGSFQKVAAKEGNRGWAIKTQANIFGYTDWNINRPANAWYCMHLWQHFTYTNDTLYLRKIAFPVMQSACEYWFDRLVEDVDGKLVAPDEWSPEQGPWQNGVSYAQQLVWELFDHSLTAARILKTDTSFISELEDKFNRLDKGLEIGDWGQIKEWKNDEANLDIQGNEHRHLSQLMALYPGNQISYHLDKSYADAAKRTLESRGDNGTGWSRAWKIACWARLFDGDHAYKLLKSALNPANITVISMDNKDGGVYENLLDAHPPFQIDGNFGATAGITEMLIQSNLGFIQLLPALPSVWTAGSFKGLKTTGNFTVDLIWDDRQPVKCTIYSGSDNICKIYYDGIHSSIIEDNEGNIIQTDKTIENLITFSTREDRLYTIFFPDNLL